MKATKKQTAQITEIAIEMNYSVEKALSTLSNCSKSIYDAIGAKGVVESSISANNYKGSAATLKASQNSNNPININ
jgi:hypothetical protein